MWKLAQNPDVNSAMPSMQIKSYCNALDLFGLKEVNSWPEAYKPTLRVFEMKQLYKPF